MSKSSKRSRKRVYRNFIILGLVFIILGGIYYYVNVYMHDPHSPAGTSEPLPEYTLLENTDSVKYAAIVMYTNNVNINNISNTFYKSNVFWPYIFIENQAAEGVKNNPLDIPKGVVLKILRLPSTTIDPENYEAVEKAKHLADSILNTVTVQ